MRSLTRRLSLGTAVLVVAALNTCSTSGPSSSAPTVKIHATMVDQGTWQTAHGPVLYGVQKVPAGKQIRRDTYALLLGDGPVLQIVYPRSAYTLSVSPDTLVFSGHTISSAGNPGTYEVDGRPIELGVSGTHRLVVSNGRPVALLD